MNFAQCNRSQSSQSRCQLGRITGESISFFHFFWKKLFIERRAKIKVFWPFLCEGLLQPQSTADPLPPAPPAACVWPRVRLERWPFFSRSSGVFPPGFNWKAHRLDDQHLIQIRSEEARCGYSAAAPLWLLFELPADFIMDQFTAVVGCFCSIYRPELQQPSPFFFLSFLCAGVWARYTGRLRPAFRHRNSS